MTAEEYFEKWWTPKELPENEFNKTAMLDFAEMYHNKALRKHDIVGRRVQLSCGRNITTCVFYKDGGKCSNLEYCRDQTT